VDAIRGGVVWCLIGLMLIVGKEVIRYGKQPEEGNVMTKLIVMLIVAGGGGPIVIQGWNNMAACEAAKAPVEAFYKGRHGKSIYTTIETKCLEFANNP
jgi:hypothetical protein